MTYAIILGLVLLAGGLWRKKTYISDAEAEAWTERQIWY